MQDCARGARAVRYSKGMKITAMSYRVLHVSAKTNWSFVQVRVDDAITGWGECSLNGWEPLQRAFADKWCAQLVGQSLDGLAAVEATCALNLHSPGGLVEHSVRSATEQALLDALAQMRGVPLWRLFGAPLRDSVELYANINRATAPRTPQGFALGARAAIAAGFAAVKLAPFDGVLPANAETPAGAALIEAGLARIRAVREAIGPQPRVMVDCHWRLTPRTAQSTLEALREVGLYWFECPLSERATCHDEILAVRRLANRMDVLTAGAETQSGVDGFRPFLERGLYDAIMPDAKYCGGIGELVRIAHLAAAHGVRTAPHNPSGPICNLASVHAAMVGEGCDLLELQVGESELFDSCVGGSGPQLRGGHFLRPERPGIGAALGETALTSHPYASVSGGLDPSLG